MGAYAIVPLLAQAARGGCTRIAGMSSPPEQVRVAKRLGLQRGGAWHCPPHVPAAPAQPPLPGPAHARWGCCRAPAAPRELHRTARWGSSWAYCPCRNRRHLSSHCLNVLPYAISRGLKSWGPPQAGWGCSNASCPCVMSGGVGVILRSLVCPAASCCDLCCTHGMPWQPVRMALLVKVIGALCKDCHQDV